MPYKIIRTPSTLVDLEREVRALGVRFAAVGAPFKDVDSREWCQAGIISESNGKNGKVRLIEPKKPK